MDLSLSPAHFALQARAAAFVRDVLQPREAEFEFGGRVQRDWGQPIRRAAFEANLRGGSFPVALGGQGWTVLEQVLVHEQFGQATGGLWSYVPGAYNALIHCTPEQRARYLAPSLRGERSGSYAITEDGAGSDARSLRATAVRGAATGEYVLDGESGSSPDPTIGTLEGGLRSVDLPSQGAAGPDPVASRVWPGTDAGSLRRRNAYPPRGPPRALCEAM